MGQVWAAKPLLGWGLLTLAQQPCWVPVLLRFPMPEAACPAC